MSKILPTNLVFSGGGVKGIAYLGVMQALYKLDFIKNIKNVAGASAGSITALLIALNYSLEEMTNLFNKLNIQVFEDPAFFGDSELLYNLIEDRGLHSGDALLSTLEQLVENKTGNKGTTFQQLHNNSNFIVNLYCMITNLNTGLPTIFSYETTPLVPVAQAIRASCGIPIFYTPFKFSCGDPNIDPYDWVDGGLVNNYPINLWDSIDGQKNSNKINDPLILQQYLINEFINFLNRSASNLSQILKDSNNRVNLYVPNMKTLGFRLFDPTEKRDPIMFHRNFSTQNIQDVITTTILAMSDQINRLEITPCYWERTISIPIGDINTTAFNLTPQQKEALVLSGYTSTLQFFPHNL